MKNETATVILDVRVDLAQGKKPLTKILAAARALQSDQGLKLITPFEPLPLFFVLKKLGLQHRSHQVAEEHWETLFAHELPDESENANVVSLSTETAPATTSPAIHTVDARGLEPPQPLVAILTALEKLAPSDSLRAQTDRRPLHLLDALTERGYIYTSEEQPDGSWSTVIRRS